jgi:hypothetical protein
MICIQFGAEPKQLLSFVLERPADGTFFDWSTGQFSATPARRFLALAEDPVSPGRYTAPAGLAQQPGQFTTGTTLVLWVVGQDDLSPLSRSVVWMVSGTVDGLPWVLTAHYLCFSVTGP